MAKVKASKMSEAEFRRYVERRFKDMEREIADSTNVVLQHLSIYDEGQARYLMPILRRISTLVEIQLIFPKLIQLKPADAKKMFIEFAEQYFDKKEIKDGEKMIDQIIADIEHAKKFVYSSPPDSKKDVA
jgi:hypothetical protein